jgi:hypothetical protein
VETDTCEVFTFPNKACGASRARFRCGRGLRRGAVWILRNRFGPTERSRSVWGGQVPVVYAVLMCRLQEARPESEAEALLLSPRGPGDAAKRTATKTAADGAERGRIYRSRHNTGDAVFRSGWEPAQQFHKVVGGCERAWCLSLLFRGASGWHVFEGGKATNRFVCSYMWGGGLSTDSRRSFGAWSCLASTCVAQVCRLEGALLSAPQTRADYETGKAEVRDLRRRAVSPIQRQQEKSRREGV